MKTNIRFLRHELGLSQQNLAKEVDVTRQTINALENGKYNPSLLLAYKITKILKCEYIEDVFLIKNEDD
ncbi:helix-turn-helix transcriptional regulator [Methanobrevibacter sp. OttesenSCG-928-K11]|nr:helix-turn-helix transcriptional regulator [Methanobrevibacter sp. OttesenSCG-928-K11]MDL2270597.1 helix-turn-helix transcriptional regulator [Methanobrevibacter sp. OttesenSCG-928-I08]